MLSRLLGRGRLRIFVLVYCLLSMLLLGLLGWLVVLEAAKVTNFSVIFAKHEDV